MAYSNFTIHVGNDTYNTITLGNEVFSMKSDISDIILPTIDNVSLIEVESSTEVEIRCTNNNQQGLNIEIDELDIWTSSSHYDLDTFDDNFGQFTSYIDGDTEDYQILYFCDECAVEGYDITFHFYYDSGTAEYDLGTLMVQK